MPERRIDTWVRGKADPHLGTSLIGMVDQTILCHLMNMAVPDAGVNRKVMIVHVFRTGRRASSIGDVELVLSQTSSSGIQ
jgi:hypothetical protein